MTSAPLPSPQASAVEGAPPIPGGLVAAPIEAARGGQAQGRALSGNLIAALSMAIWALGFPAADGLLRTWDPLAIVPFRFAMALGLLIPLWLLLEGRPRGVAGGRGWGRALGVGALGIGGGAVTLILAQAATDPVTVAVIASVSPLTGSLVEWGPDWIKGRSRPSRLFLLGLLASILGGVVATWGAGGGGNLPLGAALAVASCLLYSWGSHEAVRALPGRTALAQTTASVSGAALGVSLAWGLAWAGGWAGGLPARVGASDLGLLALYGMGGMAASQLLFVVAVRRIGIGLASFHTNAAPFYVMLMMLALGGTWSWAQAAGAGIVAAGVLLAQRR